MLKSIAMALTLVFSGGAPAQETASLDWAACPGDKIGMECADLRVPVDWSKPEGRQITLKLGLAQGHRPGRGLRARRLRRPRRPPGIAYTEPIVDTWAGLRKRMHVVVWDTRGYGEQFRGRSTGLPCVWTRVPIPAAPRDDAEWGAPVRHQPRSRRGVPPQGPRAVRQHELRRPRP
ncbi:hypothetical protein ACFSTC_05315 [Nonomuraea ferruginea]